MAAGLWAAAHGGCAAGWVCFGAANFHKEELLWGEMASIKKTKWVNKLIHISSVYHFPEINWQYKKDESLSEKSIWSVSLIQLEKKNSLLFLHYSKYYNERRDPAKHNKSSESESTWSLLMILSMWFLQFKLMLSTLCVSCGRFSRPCSKFDTTPRCVTVDLKVSSKNWQCKFLLVCDKRN